MGQTHVRLGKLGKRKREMFGNISERVLLDTRVFEGDYRLSEVLIGPAT